MDILNNKINFFNLKQSNNIDDLILKNNNFILDKKNYNYLIAIGGDGTFLECVKNNFNKKINILLYNNGNLGFFSSKFNNYKIDLKKIEFVNYKLLKIEFDNKTYYAFNEILIMSKNQTYDFKLSINNQRFYNFYASGFCINTAYGSTGLNRSLNGPMYYDNNLICFNEFLTSKYNQKNLNQALLIDKKILISSKEIIDDKNFIIKIDGQNIDNFNFKEIYFSLKESQAKIDLSFNKWIDTIQKKIL